MTSARRIVARYAKRIPGDVLSRMKLDAIVGYRTLSEANVRYSTLLYITGQYRTKYGQPRRRPHGWVMEDTVRYRRISYVNGQTLTNNSAVIRQYLRSTHATSLHPSISLTVYYHDRHITSLLKSRVINPC